MFMSVIIIFFYYSLPPSAWACGSWIPPGYLAKVRPRWRARPRPRRRACRARTRSSRSSRASSAAPLPPRHRPLVTEFGKAETPLFPRECTPPAHRNCRRHHHHHHHHCRCFFSATCVFFFFSSLFLEHPLESRHNCRFSLMTSVSLACEVDVTTILNRTVAFFFILPPGFFIQTL